MTIIDKLKLKTPLKHVTPKKARRGKKPETLQDKARDHRNGRKKETVKGARKDCRPGAQNLRRSGYRQIRMLDCRGSEYSYLAKKQHALFGAKMNAYSGKIKVSFLGPVRKH